jgi:uncharacterized membrane protein
MVLGWIRTLAFLGAIGLGLVLLFRALSGEPGQREKDEAPLTILQRRYAAGEIDRETYEHMKQELAA